MAATAAPRDEIMLRPDETCRATKRRGCASTSGKSRGQQASNRATSPLSQLVGAAKVTALARQLQPELLGGLDLALSTLDPKKVTSQLVLKAFEHVPGASAQLRQLLDDGTNSPLLAARLQPAADCSSETKLPSSESLAAGDYFVLHTEGQCPAKGANPPPPHVPPAQGSDQSMGRLLAQAEPVEEQLVGGSLRNAGKAPGNLDNAANADLVTEVLALRKHKEWADQKIDQLIRRVRDAVGPQRMLKAEVQQLRQEKDSVESKLKDFEHSLQKLKDCTYAEAAQRRQYELSLRKAEAELKGSSLREQETQGQLREVQAGLRQEKKRRESIERQHKKAVDERSDAQGLAVDAAASAAGMKTALEKAHKALQEKLIEAEAAQEALLLAQQQVKAAEARAAGMQLQLAAAEEEAASHRSEQEGVIAALTAQLDDAHSTPPACQRASSLYSHFGGPALFEADFGGLPLFEAGPSWLRPGLEGVSSFGMGLSSVERLPVGFRSAPPQEPVIQPAGSFGGLRVP